MFPSGWRMFVGYHWPKILAAMIALGVGLAILGMSCLIGCHVHLHLKDTHYYDSKGEQTTILEIEDEMARWE